MRVRELMTPDVQTIQSDATLQKAAERMAVLDIGMLPVMEEERLVGVLTDRDMVVRGVARNYDPQNDTVGDLMTTEIISIDGDKELAVAADVMHKEQVHRLVIVDQDENMIGVLTFSDMASRSGSPLLAAHAAKGIAKPPGVN